MTLIACDPLADRSMYERVEGQKILIKEIINLRKNYLQIVKIRMKREAQEMSIDSLFDLPVIQERPKRVKINLIKNQKLL